MQSEGDPLLGRQVGEFRVERKIAAGGMGAVYLLLHPHLPKKKVLKVILPELAHLPHVRERFQAETDALAQLGDHPSIVGLDYPLTLPGGQLAIMMPFCEGLPLDAYIQRHGGKLVPYRAFYVACHVARALHHAHTRGIVHRDLKPSNVFVEDDDNDLLKCRLLDFGVARRLRPSPNMPATTQIGPLGTPEYMPPEQQTRPADATSAADVYSLAVMIWWTVTSRYPWGEQDDPVTLYLRKVNEPPDSPPPGAMPAAWEHWLRAAMHPDPAMRPTLRQLMHGLAMPLEAVGRFVPSGPDILKRVALALWEESGPEDLTLRNPSKPTLQPAWPERDAAPGGDSADAAAPSPAPPSQPPTQSARAAAVQPIARSTPVRPGAGKAPVRPGASPVAVAVAVAVAAPPPAPSAPVEGNAAAGAPITRPAASMATLPAVPSAPRVAATNARPAVNRAVPSPTPTTIGASAGAMVSPSSTGPGASRWRLALVGVGTVAIACAATFALATLRGSHGDLEPAAVPREVPTTSSPAAPTAPPAKSAPPVPPPATPLPTAQGAPPGNATLSPAAPVTPARTTGAAVADNPAPAAIPSSKTPRPVAKRPGVSSSVPGKARAPTRATDAPIQDPAPDDRTRDRKFNPNAAVGGEED